MNERKIGARKWRCFAPRFDRLLPAKPTQDYPAQTRIAGRGAQSRLPCRPVRLLLLPACAASIFVRLWLPSNLFNIGQRCSPA